MPEDPLMATQAAMRANDPNGKFFGMVIIILKYAGTYLCCHGFTECPRGHKYFVGNVSQIVIFLVLGQGRGRGGGERRSLSQCIKVYPNLPLNQCGGVKYQGVCNVCRAPIGGTNYNLQQGNKPSNL